MMQKDIIKFWKKIELNSIYGNKLPHNIVEYNEEKAKFISEYGQKILRVIQTNLNV